MNQLAPRLLRTIATAATASSTTNTISAAEIALFSSLAEHWWDPTGEFALLHRMNPARVKFLRESLLKIEELDDQPRWLKNRDVLDVGCGGGIFAEALARLGANTTAVDASGTNISVAQSHAALDPSFIVPNSPIPSSSIGSSSASVEGKGKYNLNYRHCAAEDLVKEGKMFDVVCAMEVIEHVDDPRGFLDCLSDLTKPGGLLLLSTINRTPLANFLDIFAPEQILRIITPGTHTYSKFVKPEELKEYFDGKNWLGMEKRGCIYDPVYAGWRLLSALLSAGQFGGIGEKANYFAGVRKPF